MRNSRRTPGAQGTREEGSALFIAVLMLALMGAIGLAALDTVARDRQSAGFQNRAEAAFWAGEAGAAEGRALVRLVSDRGATPAFPTQASPTTLGDASLYDREDELPRYYADPAVAEPVRHIDDADFQVPGGNLGGKQPFVYTLWRVNVVGESPGAGAPARLEVVQTRVLTGGVGSGY